MAVENNFSVGIIGPGKTGLALAQSFLKRGNLAWILCRNEDQRVKIFHQGFSTAIAKFPIIIPDVIFITVRDSQIKNVVDQLLKVYETSYNKNLFKNTIFIHCSGALRRDIFQELESISAGTAAAHPYQTISRPSEDFLKGIAWGVEADMKLHEKISEIVVTLHGKPYFLSTETLLKKELYHISAVAASNFLAAAIASARDFAAAAGISEESFLPAIIKTATNNSLQSISNNNRFPLTGPIARGDLATVERHITALQSHNTLLKEYAYFSLATAEVAFKSGMISGDDFNSLQKLLHHHVYKTQ
ncbi:MAG TPA: DUF2520 domain-containing protein [Patescibacteria group bacterium]|nr:DUF2520 domain-containing protein [Patescibacteria group bacterium]